MKVAVLLRGQARYSEVAAKLFKDTIIEKHPDIDFKIFGHTWRTMSVAMIDNNFDNSVNRYHSKIFLTSEIQQKIVKWNPSRYLITGDKRLYDLAKEVINKNHYEERDALVWLRNNWNNREICNGNGLPTATFVLYPGFRHTDYAYDLNNTTDIINTLGRNHHYILENAFYLGNLFGQMYSAGLSYDVYRNRDDQSWVPDVIWSGRWDGVFECENLYNMLTHAASINTNKVYTRIVSVINSRAWIDDYNFFMANDTANLFLGNMRERLLKIYTGSKITLTDLLDSKTVMQHLMWTKLTDNGTVMSQMPVIGHNGTKSGWYDFLIRPGIERYSLNDITVDIARRASNDFKYPSSSGVLTISQMEEFMNIPDSDD